MKNEADNDHADSILYDPFPHKFSVIMQLDAARFHFIEMSEIR